MPLGKEVSLGSGHIVLYGDPVGTQPPTAAPPHFRPMPIVAKRSPISATAQLMLVLFITLLFFGCVQQTKLSIRSLLGSRKCRLSYHMVCMTEWKGKQLWCAVMSLFCKPVIMIFFTSVTLINAGISCRPVTVCLFVTSSGTLIF